jgi:hypothetical protein
MQTIIAVAHHMNPAFALPIIQKEADIKPEVLVGGVARESELTATDGPLHNGVDARLVITELGIKFADDVALRSAFRHAEVEWWARLGSNQ